MLKHRFHMNHSICDVDRTVFNIECMQCLTSCVVTIAHYINNFIVNSLNVNLCAGGYLQIFKHYRHIPYLVVSWFAWSIVVYIPHKSLDY